MSSFDERAKDWDADPGRVERARVVAEAMRGAVPLTPATRALEYGCGTGLLGFALAPHLGHVTLADSSDGMLAVLRQKIAASGAGNMAAVKLDLTTDAVPPERYDLIVSLLTLHHVPDTDRLLRDFRTLLRPGGLLCLSDLDREDGSFHGADFTGHRGFDRGRLAASAEAAGFAQVRFATPYTIRKAAAGADRGFPLFLMVAEAR